MKNIKTTETDYINASPAMIARIELADIAIAAGKGIKININEFFSNGPVRSELLLSRRAPRK
ncbi:hypothetical protein [Mucilaginibacter psychrotolerans]|uniref:hypothetical protein n=1 Tax=Mucilaginibacter psychrotolerans TaxID=1524096 RepID=UPI001865145C|nr:hypothetical protein [Mucilaginibacter psychrotolerans]